MNQTCKVCGEPAAGFHFGAFTCEGCKSFFGRSYNNLSSISECKNNGECVINKKNRTACKACRLRKCLLVGMSKSGSRYGRRSNWFKIHCLLQEQQQQAAAHAAAAAAHNHSRDHHHSNHNGSGGGGGGGGGGGVGNNNSGNQKTPPPPASALSMLGHPGAYPHGLYPARAKDDLMMLSLEEYAKHPSASPSVSSPDSHNSDSSVDINVRSNSLLRLGRDSAHPHKDLFLPLPFPGLSSLPVMPPPAFLPPSHHHLLFPGYHPALYQHHQGLLKPADLHHHQQQHSMMTSPSLMTGSIGGANNNNNNNNNNINNMNNNNNNNNNSRFTPNHNSSNDKESENASPHLHLHHQHHHHHHHNNNNNTINNNNNNNNINNNNNNNNNNNHLVNGSKAAEELTKRFYLDAVLKSQCRSPSLITNTTTTTTSYSANLTPITNSTITPNSERARSRSIKSDMDEDDADMDSNCGEDLVVSMTPPRSPILNVVGTDNDSHTERITHGQDNPIDLSMKTGSSSSSVAGSLHNSDTKSSSGSIDDINRHLSGGEDSDHNCAENGTHSDPDDDETTTTTTITTTIEKRHNQFGNSCGIRGTQSDDDEYERSIKRMKLQLTTTPLDLTTRV